jgi:hypothetical protein
MKETIMHYKTIILELLQQRTQMHERLRKERKLLTTMETLAGELRTRHQFWTEIFTSASPDSNHSQVSSEALEMALKELEDRLPHASPADEEAALSLDRAMASVLNRTSRG